MTDINAVDGGLSLYTSAKDILDVVVQTASNHLYDLPSKQYVTSGPAAYDCEQVSVAVIRVPTGITPDTAMVQGGPQCPVGWSMVYEISIVRCVPVVNNKGTATTEKLDAAFEVTSKDVHILQEVVEAINTELAIGGTTASIIPAPPNGQFLATVAQITMSWGIA